MHELSLIESPAIRSQVIMCEAGTRTLRWSKMFSEYEPHFTLMRLIMVRPSATAKIDPNEYDLSSGCRLNVDDQFSVCS